MHLPPDSQVSYTWLFNARYFARTKHLESVTRVPRTFEPRGITWFHLQTNSWWHRRSVTILSSPDLTLRASARYLSGTVLNRQYLPLWESFYRIFWAGVPAPDGTWYFCNHATARNGRLRPSHPGLPGCAHGNPCGLGRSLKAPTALV